MGGGSWKRIRRACIWLMIRIYIIAAAAASCVVVIIVGVVVGHGD